MFVFAILKYLCVININSKKQCKRDYLCILVFFLTFVG